MINADTYGHAFAYWLQSRNTQSGIKYLNQYPVNPEKSC